MHGVSYTAQKVQDGPKTSTSFGVEARLPALPCRDDVVVESGDAATKSCFPSLELRTTTVAGGLVPSGKTFTATETNFNQPSLRFYSTEETDSEARCKKGPTPSASYDSSFWKLLAAPYCRRVVETKSRKIGRLIQAVRKAIPVPARFCDRGARWFMVRLYVLEQLGDELQQVLED